MLLLHFWNFRNFTKALMPQNARSRHGVHMFEAGARFSVYGAPEGFSLRLILWNRNAA